MTDRQLLEATAKKLGVKVSEVFFIAAERKGCPCADKVAETRLSQFNKHGLLSSWIRSFCRAVLIDDLVPKGKVA